MIILGIDPGIGRTGWGVIETERKVHGFGCIETPASMLFEKRLHALYMQLQEVFIRFTPDVVAVEELFFNTNVSTAFMVGQARGVVLLLAAMHNLAVASYTPLQVKLAVTGYGRAQKTQVGQMVKVLLKLPSVPTPDDTADALAIALTHSFSYKMKQ